MDIAHAALSRITAQQNPHQWALQAVCPTSTLTDHRYYFLDQAGCSPEGDTALHRLTALHCSVAAVAHFLEHAARHRQYLLGTDTADAADTSGTPTNTTATASSKAPSPYAHLKVPPPAVTDCNAQGVTPLHVAVHRNSWHVDQTVALLLREAPTGKVASMPLWRTSTYPLHILTGHSVTLSAVALEQLIRADPTVAARQDVVGDTPLSLVWKNTLRFRWAQAWESSNQHCPYFKVAGDLSWMTVISPDQFCCYSLQLISAATEKFGLGPAVAAVNWLDVCGTDRCPPLLIRILLHRQRRQHPHLDCDYSIQALGSLADTDWAGRTPLHVAAAAAPVTLQFVPPQVASQLTTVVELILQSYPAAAAVRDGTGRLPVHYLLAACGAGSGAQQHATPASVTPSALLSLVREYPDSLSMQDPVSGLYPVQQLAAITAGDNDVVGSKNAPEIETDLIYRMLRSCPDVMSYHRNAAEPDADSQTMAVC
jgi:ankyrin repeat protein